MGLVLMLGIIVFTGVTATLGYIGWDVAIVVTAAAGLLIAALYILGIAGRRR